MREAVSDRGAAAGRQCSPFKTVGGELEGAALLTPPGSTGLARRTLAGSLWLLAGKFYRQLLFLGKAVILGRLLSPQDFGLVGGGELALQFLGVLTYTGFAEALVQRPRLTARLLHTAWWVMLGRAFMIALALFLAAPVVAGWLGAPGAVPILRALAGVQVLGAGVSMGLTLFTREMNFKAHFRWEAVGQTVDLLVAVAAALAWRSAWALVLGALAGTLTRVAASYRLHPYRPRLVFDLRDARELFGFGKWLLCSASLYFFLSKGADLMSGLLFGAAALGLYQMAARFAMLPNYHLGEVFFQVLFPAYCQLQDDPDKLRDTFLRVIQVLTFTIFPLAALMAVAAAPILPLILGSQWAEVRHLIPGLAVGGALQTLLRTAPPLFLATNRGRSQFTLDLAAALGILFCLWPLSLRFGLPGLAWAYPLGLGLALPLWWRLVRRHSRASARDLLRACTPAILGSLLMASVMLLIRSCYPPSQLAGPFLLALLIGVLCGCGLYFAAILTMERRLVGYQPWRTTVSLLRQFWQQAPVSPLKSGVQPVP